MGWQEVIGECDKSTAPFAMRSSCYVDGGGMDRYRVSV